MAFIGRSHTRPLDFGGLPYVPGVAGRVWEIKIREAAELSYSTALPEILLLVLGKVKSAVTYRWEIRPIVPIY